jgi:hypothetical protein
MDSHPGWHTVLGAVHRIGGLSTDELVVFSIVILFVFFCITPLFLLERPESWLIGLLALMLTAASPLLSRLLLGRPYLVTMSVILAMSFVWPRFRNSPVPWMHVAFLTIMITLSVWIHGLWYIYAFPIACFFLAREWRSGAMVCACVLLGVAAGSALTGHPLLFLKQTLEHMMYSLGEHTMSRMLVTEFQPFPSDPFILILVFGMLGWRALRGSWNTKVVDNPVFILATLGWVLGFAMRRFWLDMGMPALCAWIALEFDSYLVQRMRYLSLRRIYVTCGTAAVLFLVTTSDLDSRYTGALHVQYLSADDHDTKAWLPDPGGIIYSDQMLVFYQTFYKNPRGNWRYVLGFEPAWMPSEDLAIFRNIQRNYGAGPSYQDWVKKMRVEDRLILKRGGGIPDIPELEWYNATSDTWIGRLPR